MPATIARPSRFEALLTELGAISSNFAFREASILNDLDVVQDVEKATKESLKKIFEAAGVKAQRFGSPRTKSKKKSNRLHGC